MSPLEYILNIVNQHNIKYQIIGGFAANLYGSPRKLNDIDICIPSNKLKTINNKLKDFEIEPLARGKDEYWDLDLFVLTIDAQTFDIFGDENIRIYNSINKTWETLEISLVKPQIVIYENKQICVIPRKDLIAYKSKLGRDVDKRDLQYLEA